MNLINTLNQNPLLNIVGNDIILKNDRDEKHQAYLLSHMNFIFIVSAYFLFPIIYSLND